MGINVGAFICNFVAAYMRINFGWSYAFGAAGVGMLIGLVWFLAGMKHVKEADVIKPANKEDMSLGKIFTLVLLPVFGFGVLGWLIPGNIFGTDSNDAFLCGCIPVVVFYGSLWVRANKEDKRPIAALLAVFAAVIVFWAIFHQNGDALTVWAERYTDREMPVSVSKVAKAVDMVQVVTNRGDSTDAVSAKYFSNLPADQVPAKGKSLLLFSAELYQSINPFWVIVLTPVVVGIFGLIGRRRKVSTPAKITIGLLITALSALVMVAAVKTTDIAHEKASGLWLLASYGVITIGELCLSPMGLSLVSKLSPPRLTALLMGGWFLSTSIGNKLSGILSGMWEKYDDKSTFFLTNFFLAFVAFLMLLAMLRWLNRVMREKNLS